MSQILIRKGASKRVRVSFAHNPDVSNDVVTSKITASPRPDSKVLATWNVSYLNDGKDGEILLELDHEATRQISESEGYMNIERSVNGEKPMNVWDEPLEVSFER